MARTIVLSVLNHPLGVIVLSWGQRMTSSLQELEIPVDPSSSRVAEEGFWNMD